MSALIALRAYLAKTKPITALGAIASIVDLAESRGTLTSVSATDAQNLVTLSYLGGELLAYQTATLTGTFQYDLMTLYRGAYGTVIADHPSGTQFALLDGAIGHFPYPTNLIGQTVYLKFVSLNIVGGAIQDVASVPAYSYTITGAGQATVTVVTVLSSTASRPPALFCSAMCLRRLWSFQPVS